MFQESFICFNCRISFDVFFHTEWNVWLADISSGSKAVTPDVSDTVSTNDTGQSSMFADYGDDSSDPCSLGKYLKLDGSIPCFQCRACGAWGSLSESVHELFSTFVAWRDTFVTNLWMIYSWIWSISCGPTFLLTPCLFMYFYRYIILWPKTFIPREGRRIWPPGARAEGSHPPDRKHFFEQRDRGRPRRPWSRHRGPEWREYPRGAKYPFWALSECHRGGDGCVTLLGWPEHHNWWLVHRRGFRMLTMWL